ncbi:MAG TPA: hypothetical protein PL151_02885 [Phycisphaerae bacterium]|nr:hypothetical protein [Phycisphaerae bacterium]HOJ72300.1 hypothetical protein [Phycisphaerae bacterium]HOM50038.1 hypothetical protein [Phycisphaerae bacterium]HON68434.1 hypothetical protein [Phycisphaerae bacterium]HOQ85723.1 hypothetical protein [Phycisphaerae bacterium]
MSECGAVAGLVGIAFWITAALIYSAGWRVRGVLLAMIGSAALALAIWPGAQESVLSLFGKPAPASTYRISTVTPVTRPASADARTDRLPPGHPDLSAPRNGPHFTCHQDYAR